MGHCRDPIKALGRWLNDRMSKSYLNDLPEEAALRMAGHSKDPSDFHLPRAIYEESQDELQ